MMNDNWIQIEPGGLGAACGGYSLAMAPPVVGTGRESQPLQATTGADGKPLPPGPSNPGGAASGGLFPPQMLFLLVGVFGLMIVMSTMSSRKEKKKREQMLSGIGRYDRVQTLGGLIGTVVEVRDDEIVLKVDEATNTKIHFSRGSVQAVLKKGRGDSSKSDEPAAEAMRA